jgi:hypothetical protein
MVLQGTTTGGQITRKTIKGTLCCEQKEQADINSSRPEVH